MKNWFARKRQSGLTLIETLVVVALIAGFTIGAFQMVERIRNGMETNRILTDLQTTAPRIGNWLTRVFREDCNGGTAPPSTTHREVVDASPTARNGTGIWQLNAATPVPANAPCRRMWQGLHGWLKNDDNDRWRLASDTGPLVGFDINPGATGVTGTLNATLAGETGTYADAETQAAACATPGTPAVPPRLVLGIPLRNVDVCEGVVEGTLTLSPITSATCHEFDAATATDDLDAAVVLCIN